LGYGDENPSTNQVVREKSLPEKNAFFHRGAFMQRDRLYGSIFPAEEGSTLLLSGMPVELFRDRSGAV